MHVQSLSRLQFIRMSPTFFHNRLVNIIGMAILGAATDFLPIGLSLHHGRPL
jgi:hypothetical protein